MLVLIAQGAKEAQEARQHRFDLQDVSTAPNTESDLDLPCISDCSPCSTSALRLSSNSWYGVVVLKSHTNVVITRSQSVGES